jgi:uncharacterized protein (TIGR02246 family)
MARSLAAIADELDVRDLIADFADGVTRLDVHAVASLFAPDGVWEVNGWGHHRGQAAVESFVEELFSHWQGLFQAVHSGRVTINGDAATGQWYITEFGQRDGEELRVGGMYRDEYTRIDGRWMFAKRHFDILFRRIGGCREVETWPYPT